MTARQLRTIEAFRHRSYYYGMDGLGQDDSGGESVAPSPQQIAGGAVSATQGAIVAANENLPITTRIGGGLMAAGGTIALIPGGQIPGAIVAAVGALTSLIGGFFKPDLTKIEATQIVNEIQAKYLQPALDSWRALAPEHKTVSAQAATLALIDYAFTKVQQGCSNPALGTAGQRCISERLVQGGTAPWCPTPDHTGCDWYKLFRDPISSDPAVHPDPVPAVDTSGSTDATTIGGTQSAALGGMASLWIGIGLVALGVIWASE